MNIDINIIFHTGHDLDITKVKRYREYNEKINKDTNIKKQYQKTKKNILWLHDLQNREEYDDKNGDISFDD